MYKDYIKGYQLNNEKWEEKFISENYKIIIGYQIYNGDSDNDFSILVNDYPGSYKYHEFKNGKKVFEKTIGVSPFESIKYQIFMGISINVVFLPFLIICLVFISKWIKETRYLEIELLEKHYNIPTLTRRAFARIIDWLISDLICILILYLINDFNDVTLYNIFSWFNLILFYTILKLIFLLLFILMEAYSGKTPGKYLTRVKVISYSGGNIGFKKSLLRNLLRIIDQMFYGLIGIYLITFSNRFQRLGDKVAETIVIKE